jgi:hypothetical protein
LAPHTPLGSTNHQSLPTRPVDPAPPGSSDPKLRHDVKNQLGVILGFTELLLADMADDEPRTADLMEIRTATMATLELIQAL